MSPDRRLYPPFQISMNELESGAFKDTLVPSPTGTDLNIPLDAVKGATTSLEADGTIMCHGLRIDLISGTDDFEVLENIKSIIRERTRQWWINAPNNPFDFGYKISFQLNKDYSVPDVLRRKGQGQAHSSWFGMGSTQSTVEMEAIVDQSQWVEIGKALAANQPPEQATHFVMEAVADYMAYRDPDCILNICIALEIMEIKSRGLAGKKTKDYGTALLKNSALLDQGKRAIITKLFADRGHIAHGKSPYNYRQDQMIIILYLELVMEHYERYLKAFQVEGWERMARFML